MHHILYETNNLVNGSLYRGVHSTEDLNDGYLGSGNLIKLAITKYGKANFVRRILKFCKSREDALMWEAHYVPKEFVALEGTYNLIIGGIGACELNYGKDNPMYGRTFSKEHRRKLSEAHLGKTNSEDSKSKMSKTRSGAGNHRYGVKMSNETKRKLGQSLREKSRAVCTYCGAESNQGNIVRWHNENCKLKESSK